MGARPADTRSVCVHTIDVRENSGYSELMSEAFTIRSAHTGDDAAIAHARRRVGALRRAAAMRVEEVVAHGGELFRGREAPANRAYV